MSTHQQTAPASEQPQPPTSLWRELCHSSVIVATLGYFVDIYDLVLFSIVRQPSLQALGLTGEQLLDDGMFLINMQMVGMLLGGILWGIMADKKGRMTVLFGSILLYSLANIGNAFVSSVSSYAVFRFIAGVGLAGELGAAITLVSETLRTEHRGYATALIAGIGVSGAIFAGFIAKVLDWQAAYLIGGGLGLALLGLRVRMFESPMFVSLANKAERRGDITLLLSSWARVRRYLASILVGAPTWFIIGILVTFAPELTRELGAQGSVEGGTAIMWAYGGLVLGDLLSGLLSQLLRSRRQVVFIALSGLLVLTLVYLSSFSKTPAYYYGLCFALGIFAGYWAMFVTMAAEQFGTNLRATVATTAPNFVRGLLVPMTLIVTSLKPLLGLKMATLWVGLGSIAVAFAAVWATEETYGRDLDFNEVDDQSSL